jgi:ribosomal protein S18 acetylase RimI-like enzyme
MAKDYEGITIEQLAPERLDDLIDAQNEIFQDYMIQIRSSRQFFMDFLKSVGGDLRNILVALAGDRMVGYVNPVVDGLEGWIGGLGVAPGFRGRGIGTRLMLEAERLCRSRGVQEVSLEVIEGNDRAQRLYEKLGYSATKKYLTAEGRPIRFEGFGELPRPASMSEILSLHERSYKDTCWQRRKLDAVVQSARGAECYKVDGGFVLVRAVDTTGFIPFLGVVPEKRGYGKGTSLAKFALSRLHDLGAFKVALYNINEDMPTLRMLDMFDFKVTLKQIEMKKRL